MNVCEVVSVKRWLDAPDPEGPALPHSLSDKGRSTKRGYVGKEMEGNVEHRLPRMPKNRPSSNPTQKELPGRIKKLEESLRECDRRKQDFSIHVQNLARQVASENEMLRSLAAKLEHHPGRSDTHSNQQDASTTSDLTDMPIGKRSLEQPQLIHTGTPACVNGKAGLHDGPGQPISNLAPPLPIKTVKNGCPCASQSPKLAIPPGLGSIHGDDVKRHAAGNVVSCKQAISIIETAKSGQEIDELRAALGCTSSCCPDLDMCDIENGLLMMVLDGAI
ncbi:hypothetical protein FH972_021439 [Carpinus fangiana]|uniref:Uncharacterized protein n=1 Tax=Carpinus fangiana TaxID=176857 RepID=A0A5N6KPY4_9ROSI|nr:hypothetical protein FH972_021439 [Carpinus fangiana]